MIWILVVNAGGDFAAGSGIPLMTQMDKIGSEIILLLLWKPGQAAFDLFQTHDQTIAVSSPWRKPGHPTTQSSEGELKFAQPSKMAQNLQELFLWLDSLCPTTLVTLGRTIKQKV
jgi:hypothetical protein